MMFLPPCQSPSAEARFQGSRWTGGDVTLLELLFGSVAAVGLLTTPVTAAPVPAVSPVVMVWPVVLPAVAVGPPCCKEQRTEQNHGCLGGSFHFVLFSVNLDLWKRLVEKEHHTVQTFRYAGFSLIWTFAACLIICLSMKTCKSWGLITHTLCRWSWASPRFRWGDTGPWGCVFGRTRPHTGSVLQRGCHSVTVADPPGARSPLLVESHRALHTPNTHTHTQQNWNSNAHSQTYRATCVNGAYVLK